MSSIPSGEVHQPPSACGMPCPTFPGRATLVLVKTERTSTRWPKNPPGPWLVELEWATLSGRAEVVAFTLRSVGHHRPVRASDLRSIPLAAVENERRSAKARTLRKMAGDDRTLADLRRDHLEALRLTGQDASSSPAPGAPGGERPIAEGTAERAQAFEAARSARSGRPRTYSDAHWAEVAATYIRAYSEGGAPTAAVAGRWSVSPSAAGKWVAKCRRLGLLEPTTQGRPRGRRP